MRRRQAESFWSCSRTQIHHRARVWLCWVIYDQRSWHNRTIADGLPFLSLLPTHTPQLLHLMSASLTSLSSVSTGNQPWPQKIKKPTSSDSAKWATVSQPHTTPPPLETSPHRRSLHQLNPQPSHTTNTSPPSTDKPHRLAIHHPRRPALHRPNLRPIRLRLRETRHARLRRADPGARNGRQD